MPQRMAGTVERKRVRKNQRKVETIADVAVGGDMVCAMEWSVDRKIC
jgi:hypothetical protein